MEWLEKVCVYDDETWLGFLLVCFVDRENANCEENIKGFYRGW